MLKYPIFWVVRTTLADSLVRLILGVKDNGSINMSYARILPLEIMRSCSSTQTVTLNAMVILQDVRYLHIMQGMSANV